jgi:very-short-patch-repair endonuclease
LQHGVFSRAQAMASGLTNDTIARRLASGTWDKLYPGVYRVAGVPVTWRQSLLAACLAWGVGAVISHRAAAALWELIGFAPGVIELIVPRKRERAHDHIVHRPRSLQKIDVTIRDGIPVTSLARTLIDLATCTPRDALEEALDDALRCGLSLARLRWRMSELGARRVLTDLVDVRARGDVTESTFETRFLRALRGAGLPKPVAQHRIGNYRVDFAYVDARVVIECDGFRWHAGRRRFDGDRARNNVLTTKGWRVLHVTWPQLRDRPHEITDSLRALLSDLVDHR